MKLKQTVLAAATLAGAAFIALPAQAQLVTTGVSCSGNGTTMTSLSGYVACSGAFEGNNANQETDVMAQIATDWGLTNLVATDVTGGNAGSTGTLSFASQTGPFVLALKAGDAFSLYRFDASSLSGGLSTLNFDTLGVGFTSNGGQTHFGQGLSHATIYAPIPEPETYALMLAGLMAIGLMRRRLRR